ncbi:hypothetical protein V5799_023473 [Amblyomma americanum]|uniref:Uncharacterized protein n=1 Tax=Amblyomma americanum TaxID=6943 RepID=A0AAQ4FIA7_AMBAM
MHRTLATPNQCQTAGTHGEDRMMHRRQMGGFELYGVRSGITASMQCVKVLPANSWHHHHDENNHYVDQPYDLSSTKKTTKNFVTSCMVAVFECKPVGVLSALLPCGSACTKEDEEVLGDRLPAAFLKSHLPAAFLHYRPADIPSALPLRGLGCVKEDEEVLGYHQSAVFLQDRPLRGVLPQYGLADIQEERKLDHLPELYMKESPVDVPGPLPPCGLGSIKEGEKEFYDHLPAVFLKNHPAGVAGTLLPCGLTDIQEEQELAPLPDVSMKESPVDVSGAHPPIGIGSVMETEEELCALPLSGVGSVKEGEEVLGYHQPAFLLNDHQPAFFLNDRSVDVRGAFPPCRLTYFQDVQELGHLPHVSMSKCGFGSVMEVEEELCDDLPAVFLNNRTVDVGGALSPRDDSSIKEDEEELGSQQLSAFQEDRPLNVPGALLPCGFDVYKQEELDDQLPFDFKEVDLVDAPHALSPSGVGGVEMDKEEPGCQVSASYT